MCEILNVPEEKPISSAEIFVHQSGKWIKAVNKPTPLSSAKMELLGCLTSTVGGWNGT